MTDERLELDSWSIELFDLVKKAEALDWIFDFFKFIRSKVFGKKSLIHSDINQSINQSIDWTNTHKSNNNVFQSKSINQSTDASNISSDL